MGAGLWPGRLRAAENGKGDSGWTFIAVNDLHYESAECGPWFEKVVAAMKASAPAAEFCIIGGDQANRGLAEQMGPVRDIFTKLGMPLHPTVGNHDWAEDGTNRKAYDDVFPGTANAVFKHRGWQFVGVDSSDGNHYHDTVIHDSSLTWLDDTLAKLTRDEPLLLYTHFPLGDGVFYRPKNADLLPQPAHHRPVLLACAHEPRRHEGKRLVRLPRRRGKNPAGVCGDSC